MKRYTIADLQQMRDSEDHVEFKKGEQGNVSYNGAGKEKPKDRRKCILGYFTALCNEGGGRMVIGMHDDFPHQVVGTSQNKDSLGDLERQLRRILDELRDKGKIKTQGLRNYMYYMLGDALDEPPCD